MRKTHKRLLGVLVLLVAMVTGVLLLHRRGAPVRHEFVTQLPGEASHVWRSFHTAWTFSPGFPNLHTDANDLLLRQDRLYYICDYEAGCLDKVSGNLIWQHRFVTRKQVENNPYTGTTWRLSTDAQHLYACECSFSNPPDVAASRLCALDRRTGEVVWERSLNSAPQAAPCVTGDVLLLPGVDGTVTALRSGKGDVLWHRKLALADYKSAWPGMTLQAENGIGVVRIGGGRLVGFRVEEGNTLWEAHRTDSTPEEAESNAVSGFVLKEGIVYTLLNTYEMVALQAVSGKPLWRRLVTGESNSTGEVWLLGDKIVSCPGNTLAALRLTDGATLWYHGGQTVQDVYTSDTGGEEGPRIQAPSTPSRESLFLLTVSPPLIDQKPRTLQSVSDLPTLIALDPTTGKEQWQWQPDNGAPINHFIPDNQRFYFSDDQRILAVEEGEPDPFPTNTEDRRRLAKHMVYAQFLWPEPQPSLLQRLGNKFPAVASHLPQTEEETIDETDARLTLVRLGKESVPTLLDYVAYKIKNQNMPVNVVLHLHRRNCSVWDLLLDIDDRIVIPTLIQYLDSVKDPELRRQLADTLIRFGDLRALPALFRYAQTASDENMRQAALYFICRYAPAAARMPQDSPTQAQVTAYLIAHLNDPKAPLWLRLFAKFELLNNRGEAARKAALATFHMERTTRFLPKNLVLTMLDKADLEAGRVQERGFPHDFTADAICQDERGGWWAAFRCDYLGNPYHFWFVQSTDKKRWVKPVFGLDLAAQYTSVGEIGPYHLSCREGRLHLDWSVTLQSPTGANKAKPRMVPHHTEVVIADLYRDSDHDGLTDLMEKEIGTDPYRADTNGNGLKDGEDKNPLYRPHTLTDEEGIYQAVIEALCQYGREAIVAKPPTLLSRSIMTFGSDQPLRLPIPPNSKGIEIRGHAGMILPYPFRPGRPSWIDSVNGSFIQSQIGLDGLQRIGGPEEERKALEQQDPFCPSLPDQKGVPPKTFHDYFPYQRSPDGRRARVGWETYSSWVDPTDPTFDIEVRKIGGEWVPVECMQGISSSYSSSPRFVVPLHKIP